MRGRLHGLLQRKTCSGRVLMRMLLLLLLLQECDHVREMRDLILIVH